MKRYSIMVTETGANHEVELCQCENNPKDIAQAAAGKTLGRGKDRLPRYSGVRIVDRGELPDKGRAA